MTSTQPTWGETWRRRDARLAKRFGYGLPSRQGERFNLERSRNRQADQEDKAGWREQASIDTPITAYGPPRRDFVPARCTTPLEEAEQAELRRLLDELPDLERRVLTLSLEGHGCRAIGRRLGLTESAATEARRRAERRLRQRLGLPKHVTCLRCWQPSEGVSYCAACRRRRHLERCARIPEGLRRQRVKDSVVVTFNLSTEYFAALRSICESEPSTRAVFVRRALSDPRLSETLSGARLVKGSCHVTVHLPPALAKVCETIAATRGLSLVRLVRLAVAAHIDQRRHVVSVEEDVA